MSAHYIVTADHGHVRFFRHHQPPGQSTPSFEEEQSLDFPAGMRSYTDRDTDMAGRFQSSNHQSRGEGAPVGRTGMSIDERLPMKREEERRQSRDIKETIDVFLKARPDATWDFAAPAAVHQTILDGLSPDTRARLKQVLAKDLVNQPINEIRTHFAVGQAQSR
jgi:hypothetical protein